MLNRVISDKNRKINLPSYPFTVDIIYFNKETLLTLL